MHDELWRRIETVLDSRGDPLTDADTAPALMQDPAARVIVERLMSRLEQLPEEIRRGHRRRRRIATVAAAAVVLTGLLVSTLEQAPPSMPETVQRTANVTLVVETIRPEPPRGARVVLVERHVMAWNLEEQ